MERIYKHKRLVLKLENEDKETIKEILARGVKSVRVIKRARILELLNQGLSPNRAAAAIGVTPETARDIGKRYNSGGIRRALYDLPRPGKEPLLNKKQETRIIAIACSKPPEGRARWSTSLLAEEAVRRRIVKAVSRETIRILLKSHDLKPWREKNVVHSGWVG